MLTPVFISIIQSILLHVTLLILFMFTIKTMSSLVEYYNMILFKLAFDFLRVEIGNSILVQHNF